MSVTVAGAAAAWLLKTEGKVGPFEFSYYTRHRIDAADRPQRVSVGSLRRVLDALGYPNGSMSDIAESSRRLRDRLNAEAAGFCIVHSAFCIQAAVFQRPATRPARCAPCSPDRLP